MSIYKYKNAVGFFVSSVNLTEQEVTENDLVIANVDEYKNHIEQLIKNKVGLGVSVDDDIEQCKKAGLDDVWVRNIIENQQEVIAQNNNYHEDKLIEKNKKLAGFDYNGVMCSATRDDQNGLLAIAYKLQIMGVNFTPTVFEFENGNKLTLKKENFADFQQKWLVFRDDFFKVGAE